jgi:hypothetical protein
MKNLKRKKNMQEYLEKRLAKYERRIQTLALAAYEVRQALQKLNVKIVPETTKIEEKV